MAALIKSRREETSPDNFVLVEEVEIPVGEYLPMSIFLAVSMSLSMAPWISQDGRRLARAT